MVDAPCCTIHGHWYRHGSVRHRFPSVWNLFQMGESIQRSYYCNGLAYDHWKSPSHLSFDHSRIRSCHSTLRNQFLRRSEPCLHFTSWFRFLRSFENENGRLGSAASYGVFFYNASKGNLTALSSLTFLTPVFATVTGYLVLNETLTPLQLMGATITLGAVFLINAQKQQTE